MSETEHIRGRVRIVRELKDISFKDGIDYLLKENLISQDDHDYCDVKDCYINSDSGYIYSNGLFFEILRKDNIDPYEDIQRIRKCTSNEFEFEFKFYNGGTCFSEMLDNSLSKLLKGKS